MGLGRRDAVFVTGTCRPAAMNHGGGEIQCSSWGRVVPRMRSPFRLECYDAVACLNMAHKAGFRTVADLFDGTGGLHDPRWGFDVGAPKDAFKGGRQGNASGRIGTALNNSDCGGPPLTESWTRYSPGKKPSLGALSETAFRWSGSRERRVLPNF